MPPRCAIGGANGAYLTSPIQRFARDVATTITHVSLNREEIAETYGRPLWEEGAPTVL